MNQAFSIPRFLEFCRSLKIESKEYGERSLLPLFSTQRYLLHRIARGINAGKREFVILKARQQGISTLCIALDLYWNFEHGGLQSAIIPDSDSNLAMFRDTIRGFYHSLPPRFRWKKRVDNMEMFAFSNKSRLQYLVAGAKKRGRLGRSRAINFLHASELSSWVDEEGLDSLKNSLAETYPDRLYIWESTARGFNMFYDMWEKALASASQGAIFIAWWMHDLYRIPRSDLRFRAFHTEALTPEEHRRVSEVKKTYGYAIAPEQIAWYRWKLADQMGDKLPSMLQEHPWTVEDAFQMTGSKFFHSIPLGFAMREARDERPEYWSYSFGDDFFQARLIPGSPRHHMLKVWEYPRPDGVYCIGADPAYGSSDTSDQFCAQVLRCYADRVTQVAEFATPACNGNHFAWALGHLCGVYRGKPGFCRLNLEKQGGGEAVMLELKRIKNNAQYYDQLRRMVQDPSPLEFKELLRACAFFLYLKPDSLGKNYVYNFSTGARNKEVIMGLLRNHFENSSLNRLVIRSVPLLEEMRGVVQDGRSIRAGGAHGDDRVMAMALAIFNWVKWLHPVLLNRMRLFYKPDPPADTGIIQPESTLITDMMRRRGIAA